MRACQGGVARGPLVIVTLAKQPTTRNWHSQTTNIFWDSAFSKSLDFLNEESHAYFALKLETVSLGKACKNSSKLERLSGEM